jgi:hypothetical protein
MGKNGSVSFFLGLLTGGVLGVILERLVGHPIDHFIVQPIAAARRRRVQAKLANGLRVENELAFIDGSALFIHQYVPGGFSIGSISARMDTSTSPLDQRLQRSVATRHFPDSSTLDQAVTRWAHSLEADEHFWNGVSLALSRCEISRVSDTEDPTLTLAFREVDYATACAVEEIWVSIDLATRRSLGGNELRRVDPLLCNGFGLNCTIETADGVVLLTRRSDLARGWQRHSHISFNEGLSKMDRTPGGTVDLVGAFARGMHEELGIAASQIPDFQHRLVIHSLILDVDRYQWGLLAHLNLEDTNITSTAIRIARNLGAAPDDWEASDIWTLPFSASAGPVIAEISRPGPWVAHGLLNLALSAAHRHPASANDIRAALASHHRH